MKTFLIFFLLLLAVNIMAQSIVYGDVSFTTKKLKGFEILGKSNGLYVISRQIGDEECLSFFNSEMRETKLVSLPFINKQNKLVGFSINNNGINVVASLAEKNMNLLSSTFISSKTFLADETIALDSFNTGRSNNSVFHLVKSKSGEKFVLIRINRSERLKSLLFDVLLMASPSSLLQKKSFSIPVAAQAEDIEALELADNGHLFFAVAGRKKDGSYIQQLSFYELLPQTDSFIKKTIPVTDFYPDRVSLFINNNQQTCHLFSFASAGEKGNIDGFFSAIIKMGTNEQSVKTSVYKFSQAQRIAANKRLSTDIAFNDFYITDAASRFNGRLVVIAECLYTASRETNINRWQRPFPDGWRNAFTGFLNFSEQAQQNSIAYGTMNPANDYGGTNRRLTVTNPGENQFHSENLLLIELDEEGAASVLNFLNKMQQSGIPDEISYISLKRNDALLLFYNEWLRKKTLLNIRLLNEKLQAAEMSLLKGLLPEYRLLNRLGVQVSNNEIVVPSVKNNQYVFTLIKY
jgi:hypothetical protein